jgi:DNA-binding NarL/FixJ family response regulator
MSRSASGRAPEPKPLSRGEAEERALVAAALLLTAAGYRVDPMPPATPFVDTAGDRPALTARERQVASLLVEGASNKVIARRLDISVHTAKFHVAAVLEKLGARNRSDAVAIALRDGLVAL